MQVSQHWEEDFFSEKRKIHSTCLSGNNAMQGEKVNVNKKHIKLQNDTVMLGTHCVNNLVNPNPNPLTPTLTLANPNPGLFLHFTEKWVNPTQDTCVLCLHSERGTMFDQTVKCDTTTR